MFTGIFVMCSLLAGNSFWVPPSEGVNVDLPGAPPVRSPAVEVAAALDIEGGLRLALLLGQRRQAELGLYGLG
jgi:hypothetical protein